MSLISGDVNDPVYQVRLTIGDADGELVTDDVIYDVLNNNTNDVRQTSIYLLKAILAEVSGMINHQVGDVKVEYRLLYETKKSLLDSIIKDPAYMTKAFGFVVGGIYKDKVLANRANLNLINPSVYIGKFTGDG